MKRLWIMLSLMAAVILTACGARADHVEDTRAFLEALNQGDTDAARAYVCEERVDEIMTGLSSIGSDERESWAFNNVSCRAEGEDVRCSYEITQELDDGTQEVTSADVVFNIEDGHVCGFEETIGE